MSETRIFDGIIKKLRQEGKPGGPLTGATFVAKDNFDLAGYQTGAGVPDWKRTHPAARATAPAITALLDAGASLVGKSCMDELAFSLDGINVHYGIPANPNLPGCIPGGSSSGSASAVAAGLCDLALGTDTAGSVRVPGAFCGIFSMRPSHGAISTCGVVPLGPSFDTVGWFGRRSDLFIQCGEVLLNTTGCDANLPDICLVSDCLEILDEKLRPGFLSVAARLGVPTSADEAVELPRESLEQWVAIFDAIRCFETWQYFGKWFEETDPSMQSVIKARFMNARSVSQAQKLQAEADRAGVIDFLDHLLTSRMLCIPTVFNWPPACTASEEELAYHRRMNLRLSIMAGIGGLPQLNIPVRLPDSSARFGLSFVGRRGADGTLLALLARLKEARLIQDAEIKM